MTAVEAQRVRSVETVDVPCSNCGGHDDQVLYRGREHDYTTTTTDEFSVVRCARCGLARLNPRPDVTELGQIYPPEYYAYHLVENNERAVQRSPVARFTEAMKVRKYQSELKHAIRVAGLQDRPTIRLLDVGCADGRLLDWYKAGSEGSRIETHGIDMDEAAVARARKAGHRAVVGRFEQDRELEDGTFDLILAGHVIEHVDDPVAFAQRAADLLAPGGLFVPATPNIDSWDARRFGRFWGGNHFPRHWTLYDAASITALMDKVGLEVVGVVYEANPVFWVWSFHSWLRNRFPKAAWPDRLFPTIGIFHAGPVSFVLLSIFTIVDLVQKRVTGKTASMAVYSRKPRV